MFVKIEMLFFLIPLCCGRVMDTPHSSQEIGKNKISLNKDASRRILQPTLNMRNNPPAFQEYLTGESKFMECEVGGTPPPTIHWLKDGKKIAENVYDTRHTSGEESAVLESNLGLGFTRSRLFLDCINPSDAGRYTCVSENEFYRIFRNSQVFVPDTVEVDNTICLAKKTYGTPARIQMWTHTRLEVIGTDVQLFCRSSGDPQPRTTWRGPNKKPLIDAKKYEVLPNGDLIIRKIMWTDMGGYSCMTKNSEGSDEVTVFLYPTMPDSETE